MCRWQMPAGSFPSQKMTIREKLSAEGNSEDEILTVIFRNIYPLHSRIWWWVRVKLSFDPFTAEREFLTDVGNAHSVKDIDIASQDYRFQSPERKAWFMKPSRHRAKRYFRRTFASALAQPDGARAGQT
jgi:hypothetical protein